MFSNQLRSGTSAILALGIMAGAAAPLFAPTPAFAQATFSDVSSNYWAKGFIQSLASQGIIAGFPDGTFRPDAPVTRAQYAAMVQKAFQKAKIRNRVNFADVPSNFWAANAIGNSYEMAFLSGYPGNVFQPNQNIPRSQVLVSLASGLNYTASRPNSTLLGVYNDSADIPNYAVDKIAAATDKNIVVNYPNVSFLNPNQNATRADVAAFIYQALVSDGKASAISSPYIVSLQPAQPQQVRILAGATIPVKYDKTKILVAPNEPKPVPLTLTVAQNLVSSQGTVLVPANSQVTGEIRTTSKGAQFVAKELVLTNGQRYSIDATSKLVTTTEQITKGVNVALLLRNAAMGAAAAAAVAGVTGDKAIATEEVLLGAGVSSVLSLIGVLPTRDKVDLFSVNPNTDFGLTLNSDLVLR